VHVHRSAHLTSPARTRETRQKNNQDLLAQALEALRVVRANHKAWRELWPYEQAAVCGAGETIEAELKRRA
jgi:hypothetical protein